MKIVAPSLVVTESDAFTNDVFDRQPFGLALMNLIARSNEELVISLDGKWGEGKTTFVRMWQGLLRTSGIPSIYVDAFQSDYSQDAFVAIAAAITRFAESNLEDDEAGGAFKETAKKVGVHLLTWSAKLGIKAATLGAIRDADIEALADIKSDIAGGASGVIADFIRERLSSHEKHVELIQAFKAQLSELPSKVSGNGSGRLVIVIDELDRCKPSFAVEILEKIKHLFSAPNIVFVLVMHKEQLEAAIRSVYGGNIDAHTYLQKFINIETSIPKRRLDRHENDAGIYSRRLLQLHELETWGDQRNIVECIDPLAQHFDLSLRQLERVYTNLAIIYGTLAENYLRIVPLIVFVCVLKVVKPTIFSRLLTMRISYAELCEEVGIDVEDDGTERQRKLDWIMNWMRYAMLTEEQFNALGADDPIKSYGRTLWEYNTSRERLLPLFCGALSMFAVN